MPIDASVLQPYARRIESDLRDNVLAFWLRHSFDEKHHTFFGSISNDLVVDPSAERGALLTSRILWTFSAAYRQFGDAAYRQMADRAYDDLMARFYDREHGGFFWSIAADGNVLRDRKQVYGQAFAIYALAEYHRATGSPAARQCAISVFQLLEAHARDPRHGGYFEAFSREWKPIADMRLSAVDLNEPKSQNTHLHVMEAYTNLLRVWPVIDLRKAQRELVELMLGRIVNAASGHLGLFFAEDWALRSDKVSYGHDIEAAWLFTEAAELLDEAPLKRRIQDLAIKIAQVTLAEGVDADGGVFNEGGPSGLTDTRKEWWPQAEAVVGFLNAYELGRDERHLTAALRTWDFIERNLIDRHQGEWIRGVTRDGKIMPDLKVSFWKCPYHNGRAGLEAPRRLRAIAQ